MKDRYRGHGAAAWRPRADSWAGCLPVFDLNKMDMPLSWKEMARVTDLGSRCSGLSAECSLLPHRPPLLLNEYWELVFVAGTISIAPGRLEVSLWILRSCKARRSTLPMSMEARHAPRGPLLIPQRRILLAILWRSVTIFDMPWWNLYILKGWEGHCLAPHKGGVVDWKRWHGPERVTLLVMACGT
eukprot:1161732-Pelagomonas_calceolata.AAC.2